MKIGFVINPLAGIGGAVALKGSDGREVVERAVSLGGHSQAQQRALAAMSKVSANNELSFFTAAGNMGEKVLKELAMPYRVIYQVATSASITSEPLDSVSIISTPVTSVPISVPAAAPTNTALTTASLTSADDTKNIIRLFVEEGVDLIVFAGGDGTARDVLDALDMGMGTESSLAIPVIGIPAGVKIHSAVYAITPSHAGELIELIASGKPMSMVDAQVMDLDEQAFRDGKVKAKCYGYLAVPIDDTRMQLIKQGGLNHHEVAAQEIATDVIEEMEQDVMYLIGSGSTTAEIMNQLDLANTLLGVDIVCNHALIKNDVDEKTILEVIKNQHAKIIITVIGGQGHVFGRGNQQLSASVIRMVGRDNMIIIASNEKLRSLNKRPMIADTGDVILDQELTGLYAVISGYQQKTLYKLNA